MRCTNYLKIAEMKQILQYCFPNNRELYINLSKCINELTQNNTFSGYKRHPIILVIDEVLQHFDPFTSFQFNSLVIALP